MMNDEIAKTIMIKKEQKKNSSIIQPNSWSDSWYQDNQIENKPNKITKHDS
jgi:hypothetical protein